MKFNRLKLILKKIFELIRFFFNLKDLIEDIKVNQGIILTFNNLTRTSNDIKEYEFKIFSQGGEDGILQHLINSIEIKNKTFIEFGVEDFYESNCRFLLMKDKYKGFVIDGSKKNIKRLKNYNYFLKNNLIAVNYFVNIDNISNILQMSNFEEDLAVLSVDLDGNDYFIIEKINNFKPRILIAEYNSLFGDYRKISIPYQSDFNMTKAHYSNLYFGASLAAITYIANKKGLELVGTTSDGINAFFVRSDLLNNRIKAISVKSAFTKINLHTSRDKNYNLSFLSYNQRQDLIKNMPVFEVEKKIYEKF